MDFGNLQVAIEKNLFRGSRSTSHTWYFFFANLYLETGNGSTDYNELWSKKVTGTGQWFCFVEWNIFTVFVTFLCVVPPLVSADTCGIISSPVQWSVLPVHRPLRGLAGSWLKCLSACSVTSVCPHGSVQMGEIWYFHWGIGFPYVIFTYDKAE